MYVHQQLSDKCLACWRLYGTDGRAVKIEVASSKKNNPNDYIFVGFGHRIKCGCTSRIII